MGLSTRSGLAVIGAAGDVLSADDLNQLQKGELAIRRVLADLLGGEGLYSGGAAAVGDLAAGGASYPAFRAVLYDDTGEAWWVSAAAAVAMTFAVTSGACAAYLVLTQTTGVTPAMAVGGRTDCSILVQLAATAAPAHSLKLGTGTVVASAFTTWTPESGLFPAMTLAPADHGSTHTDGSDDVADLVGDSGSGGTHGLVPAPAAGDAAAGKYLKADGAWDVPAGAGSFNDFTVAGDDGTPQTIDDGNTLNVLGSDGGFTVTAGATDTLQLTMNLADTRPGLEKVSKYGGGYGWQTKTGIKRAVLPLAIGDGSGVIATGVLPIAVSIPFACVVVEATLLADQTGSLVIDIWKDTYANYPPTVADSICASAKPTLSSAQKATDTTLTGWTTSLAAGDVLKFNVDSAATVTWATLNLVLERG